MQGGPLRIGVHNGRPVPIDANGRILDPHTTKVNVRVGDLPASVITRLDARLALASPNTVISVPFPLYLEIQRARGQRMALVPVPNLSLPVYKPKAITKPKPNVLLTLDDMLDQISLEKLRDEHKVVELTLQELMKAVVFGAPTRSITEETICLRWDANSKEKLEFSVEGCIANKKTNARTQWKEVYRGAGMEYRVQHLQPGITYFFRARAYSSRLDLWGKYSSEKAIVTRGELHPRTDWDQPLKSNLDLKREKQKAKKKRSKQKKSADRKEEVEERRRKEQAEAQRRKEEKRLKMEEERKQREEEKRLREEQEKERKAQARAARKAKAEAARKRKEEEEKKRLEEEDRQRRIEEAREAERQKVEAERQERLRKMREEEEAYERMIEKRRKELEEQEIQRLMRTTGKSRDEVVALQEQTENKLLNDDEEEEESSSSDGAKILTLRFEAMTNCGFCDAVLDQTERTFRPCKCGYRICAFCFCDLQEADNRCPNCSRRYKAEAILERCDKRIFEMTQKRIRETSKVERQKKRERNAKLRKERQKEEREKRKKERKERKRKEKEEANKKPVDYHTELLRDFISHQKCSGAKRDVLLRKDSVESNELRPASLNHDEDMFSPSNFPDLHGEEDFSEEDYEYVEESSTETDDSEIENMLEEQNRAMELLMENKKREEMLQKQRELVKQEETDDILELDLRKERVLKVQEQMERNIKKRGKQIARERRERRLTRKEKRRQREAAEKAARAKAKSQSQEKQSKTKRTKKQPKQPVKLSRLEMEQREAEIDRKLNRPKISKWQKIWDEVKSFSILHWISAFLAIVAVFCFPDLASKAQAALKTEPGSIKVERKSRGPLKTTPMSYNCAPLRAFLEKGDEVVSPTWCYFEHSPLRDGQSPGEIVKKLIKNPQPKSTLIAREIIATLKAGNFDKIEVTVHGLFSSQMKASIQDTISGTQHRKRVVLKMSGARAPVSVEAQKLRSLLESQMRIKSHNALPEINNIPPLGTLEDFDFHSFLETLRTAQDNGLLQQMSGSLLHVKQKCLSNSSPYIKFVSETMLQAQTRSQIEELESIPTLFLNTKLHQFSNEELDFFQFLDPSSEMLPTYPDFVNVIGSDAGDRSEANIDGRPSLEHANLLKLTLDVLNHEMEKGKITYPLKRKHYMDDGSNCRVNLKLIQK